MPRRILFACQEAYRNIRLNRAASLSFFCLVSFNLLLISSSFVLFVNTNYYIEILTLGGVPGLLYGIKIPILARIDLFLVFQILVVFILGCCLFYTDKIYLDKYLLFYQHEIRLMNKLQCQAKLIKRPIIYIAYLINAAAIITVLGLIYLLYSILFYFLGERYFFLLQFTRFNSALLFVLFITVYSALIAAKHYVFRKGKGG